MVLYPKSDGGRAVMVPDHFRKQLPSSAVVVDAQPAPTPAAPEPSLRDLDVDLAAADQEQAIRDNAERARVNLAGGHRQPRKGG